MLSSREERKGRSEGGSESKGIKNRFFMSNQLPDSSGRGIEFQLLVPFYKLEKQIWPLKSIAFYIQNFNEQTFSMIGKLKTSLQVLHSLRLSHSKGKHCVGW